MITKIAFFSLITIYFFVQNISVHNAVVEISVNNLFFINKVSMSICSMEILRFSHIFCAQYEFKINSLFDIVMNEKLLQGAEKVFYHDQKTTRICRLSEEIDEEWVKEQLAMLEQQQYQIQQYEHEEMDSEDQNVESKQHDGHKC